MIFKIGDKVTALGEGTWGLKRDATYEVVGYETANDATIKVKLIVEGAPEECITVESPEAWLAPADERVAMATPTTILVDAMVDIINACPDMPPCGSTFRDEEVPRCRRCAIAAAVLSGVDL